MTRSLIVSFLLFGLVLTGCKDSNDVVSGDTFPENMQGVWQSMSYSETGSDGSNFEGSFEEDGDLLGLYFTEDRIGYWDYFGDEFDEGEDCYLADTAAVLMSFEGDIFRIMDLEEGQEVELTIRLDDSEMTLSGSDEFEGVTYDYRETFSPYNKTVAQMTPVCDFNFKKTDLEAKVQKLRRRLR